MAKLFIETTWFTQEVTARLDDLAFSRLQTHLMANPDVGVVMPGCGGLRKARWTDPKRQKGKRGGMRLIYLHVPEADWIVLLDLFDKDEKQDLNVSERNSLKRLAEQFKLEALRNKRKKQ